MNRTKILWGILGLIFLILFNTVFFLLTGTKHSALVWISYGFIHFAYIMLLVTMKLTVPSKSAHLLGVAIESISLIYFFAELIVGAIFICIAAGDWKIAFVVQLTIACVYAAVLIINLLANEKTATEENRSDIEMQNIRCASQRLSTLMKNTPDMKQKKTLEKAFDLLQSCPTVSYPSLRELEQEIFTNIQAIEAAVANEDNPELDSCISGLQELVSRRNQQLRQLQQ